MDELCGGKSQWNGLIGQINCAWRRVSYQAMYKLNVAQHHTNRNSYLQQINITLQYVDGFRKQATEFVCDLVRMRDQVRELLLQVRAAHARSW